MERGGQRESAVPAFATRAGAKAPTGSTPAKQASIDLRREAGDKQAVASKIKWNDDRVRGAATALLLIARDRIARGRTGNLIASSLAEFRADPDGYKENRKTWPDVRDLKPLGDPGKVARYQALLRSVDGLLAQWAQAKRQFNSLLELDNAIVERLGGTN
jgi:hypothetical protein